MDAFDEKLAASGFNIHYAYLRNTYYNYLLGYIWLHQTKTKNVKTSDSCAANFFLFFIGLQLLLIYDCEQQKIKAFL
jgi:hypothetical protein